MALKWPSVYWCAIKKLLTMPQMIMPFSLQII